MRVVLLWAILCSAFGLLSGCSAPQTQNTPQSLEKVLQGGPIQLQINPGKALQIVLDGNATTGYTWQFTNENPQIVAVEKGKYIPVNAQMPGAPGKFTWNIKALCPGQAKLVFRYYRTWEGFDPAQDREQIYIVTVPQP